MNLETILNNEFLTNDEKSEAIIYWENNMRAGKFFLMKGKKKLWIMSIRMFSYIRNYLKAGMWLNGSHTANLQNIKYLTEGGFSKIYMADWIGGRYSGWGSKKQQLNRFGKCKILFKC